jgi:hypothetical protein
MHTLETIVKLKPLLGDGIYDEREREYVKEGMRELDDEAFKNHCVRYFFQIMKPSLTFSTPTDICHYLCLLIQESSLVHMKIYILYTCISINFF